MSTQNKEPKIYYRSRMKIFPGGAREIMYSCDAIFTPKNSSGAESGSVVRRSDDSGEPIAAKDISPEAAQANFDRSRRRARAKVRDLALANRFHWFVTLTLDATMVNRYDFKSIQRVLTRWLSNQVQRRGLSYILVPERHKDGAFHFHGLFSDGLEAIDSGHTDAAGHPVFNLPGWGFGFSAAIQIYGDYAQAVSYVCKYIGKQGEKPGGRWYYSGGKLEQPTVLYGVCEDWDDGQRLASSFGPLAAEAYTFTIKETGNKIGIIRQNM